MIIDDIKITIGRLPGPAAQWLGYAAERMGLAGEHFRLWRRLGYPKRIMAGPFEGMRYLPTAAGSAIVPKWIGTYESELFPILEQWSTLDFDRLVDVGAADGYYAVGLVRRLRIPAICFDTNPYSRGVLAKIARLNGLRDRIDIRGTCGIDDLKSALMDAARPLLIMDCEGFEDELLNPVQVPALRQAWVLVESHDIFKAGVSGRLRERFEDTHQIETIPVLERDFAGIASRFGFNAAEVKFAVEEGRPRDMVWLAMSPRDKQTGSPE